MPRSELCRSVFGIVLLLVAATTTSSVARGATRTAPALSTCSALDRNVRDALHGILEEYFPPPNTLTCGMHFGTGFQVLRSDRDRVIPCLLEIEQRGLANTGLWSRGDGPPDVRRWILGMIGEIDPILAIRLYSMRVATASDPWVRLDLRLKMLQLGDRGSTDAIVKILGGVDPASLRPHDRRAPKEGTVVEAISTLVRYDDRDVLPVLKAVRRVVGADQRYLGVWVAQLERDLPTLERLARDGAIWSFALDSLARVGAREILERFASDPKFYGHETARMLLDKGLPPLPPAVDSASPCTRLDDRGKRELSYWVVERFPPPGHRGSDCGTQSLPFALMAQKEIASTCLEDVYRHGMTGSGAWSGSAPEPYPGAAILGLLGPVDPRRAAQLWRDWRDSPGRTAWQRGYADWMRLGLGDTDAVSGAVTYLRNALESPRNKPDGPEYLVDELAAALIRVDHRPALSLLEKWRARGALHGGLFDIGLAQLGRNSTALERLARDSQQASAAVEALGFVNARDALKRLADDPNYKYRSWAMNELAKHR